MTKKSKTPLISNKKAWILLLIILTFVAGFLIARARYKPQIEETRQMVEEKSTEITSLKTKILELEHKIEATDLEF